MADLTTQNVTEAGFAITYQAADVAGDTLLDPDAFIHVKNGGGSSITVTIVAQVPCDQGVLHNQVVTVPNGADRFIGPFDDRFRLNNETSVTYSGVTSVTVAALQVA